MTVFGLTCSFTFPWFFNKELTSATLAPLFTLTDCIYLRKYFKEKFIFFVQCHSSISTEVFQRCQFVQHMNVTVLHRIKIFGIRSFSFSVHSPVLTEHADLFHKYSQSIYRNFQNPAKHLRWSFLQKWLTLKAAIFTESSILDVLLVSKYLCSPEMVKTGPGTIGAFLNQPRTFSALNILFFDNPALTVCAHFVKQ